MLRVLKSAILFSMIVCSFSAKTFSASEQGPESSERTMKMISESIQELSQAELPPDLRLEKMYDLSHQLKYFALLRIESPKTLSTENLNSDDRYLRLETTVSFFFPTGSSLPRLADFRKERCRGFELQLDRYLHGVPAESQLNVVRTKNEELTSWAVEQVRSICKTSSK